MILRYQVDEGNVQAAWLKTLYELIEELNCKCDTYLEEAKYTPFRKFKRKRVVEVYGSDTMVSWLKLRMERYSHFIGSFNKKPEIKIITEN